MLAPVLMLVLVLVLILVLVLVTGASGTGTGGYSGAGAGAVSLSRCFFHFLPSTVALNVRYSALSSTWWLGVPIKHSGWSAIMPAGTT